MGKLALQQGWMVMRMIQRLRDHIGVEAMEFISLRELLYHIALIALSRLYLDISWATLQQELPGISGLGELHNHALQALHYMEQRLPLVRLEALFYLPMTLVIALECQTRSDFDRIEAAISTIGNKGFALARTYLADVQLLWEFRSVSASDGVAQVVD